MNKTECKLQMLDLYFSKFDFIQNRDKRSEDPEYNTSININYAINSKDETKIKTTIDTIVKDKSESILVNLQTVGIFRMDKNDVDADVYDHLIKVNTVAIMLPYIRSQISLITTQPGIIPIMIPPINVNSLAEKQENQTKE